MERYTRNFLVSEFLSPDGRVPDIMMDPVLMTRLQALRDIWGDELFVVSGVRSIAHNAHVGGAVESNHLTGHAADLDISEFDAGDRWDFIRLCFAMHFKGVGITDKFIHLDMRRGHRSTWTY